MTAFRAFIKPVHSVWCPRHQENVAAREEFTNGNRRVDAIDAVHYDIHENKIRRRLQGNLNSLGAVVGCDRIEPVLKENDRQSISQPLVVSTTSTRGVASEGIIFDPQSELSSWEEKAGGRGEQRNDTTLRKEVSI
jgi:hypothetical protein